MDFIALMDDKIREIKAASDSSDWGWCSDRDGYYLFEKRGIKNPERVIFIKDAIRHQFIKSVEAFIEGLFWHPYSGRFE